MHLLTVSALLLILGHQALVPASAIPSFVHEDLLSYPYYQMVFEKEIANSSLAEIFKIDVERTTGPAGSISVATTDTPRSDGASKSDNDDAPYPPIIMKTSGKSFLCQILPPRSKVTDGTDDHVDEAVERKGVERGLQLLNSMGCLYLPTGWWTYEFCHLRYVRQFHQPATAQGLIAIPSRDDPSATAFYLGISDDYETNTLYQGTPQSSADTVSHTTLQVSENERYLVQRWGGGTTCDVTGKARKVEIRFHCNMQSPEHIAFIKETSICHYLVMVHTPRLCDDPAFLSSRTEVNSIVCNLIVSDAQYELAAQERAQIEADAHVKFHTDVEREIAPAEEEIVLVDAALHREERTSTGGQYVEDIASEQGTKEEKV